MEHAGGLLARTHRELLVSKYRRRQVEGIALVPPAPRGGSAESRLPLAAVRVLRDASAPAAEGPVALRASEWQRRPADHRAPGIRSAFGQDRLAPIFLATLAVRQQSRVIRFKSASVMLDMFGMSNVGKEYRRLVAAFERMFGATMFFGTEPSATVRVVHRARFNFLSEATIWYQRESGDENVVTLSQEFFAEVMAHPIPADLEAVKVLVASPGALDLFLWLSYRCFTVKSREAIPLFGPNGLAHQLGCVDYSRPRRFRAMLDQWIVAIRDVWPDCPAEIDRSGQHLSIANAFAVDHSFTRSSASVSHCRPEFRPNYSNGSVPSSGRQRGPSETSWC